MRCVQSAIQDKCARSRCVQEVELLPPTREVVGSIPDPWYFKKKERKKRKCAALNMLLENKKEKLKRNKVSLTEGTEDDLSK